MENEKYKSQNHKLMLYPEDITHMKALEMLKEEYEIAYILHDKDVYTKKNEEKNPENKEGTLKKPHYHVLLRTKSQTWNTALAKKLGITSNYIQQVSDFTKFARYLIHLDDEDKYLYNIDEVKGNLLGKVKECVAMEKEKSEVEKVINVLDIFDENVDNYITTKDFLRWSCNNGCYDVVRRNATMFIQVIKEHNEKVKKTIDEQGM